MTIGNRPATVRADGRRPTDLRPVTLTLGVQKWAEGSCRIRVGDTEVLCAATIVDRVPPHLRGKGTGWVTAEYSMLPRATAERTDRESVKGRIGGRTHEIQRLIGRSLRGVVDLSRIGERTITVDCDVLQADGGTRTASITGGYVALAAALITSGMERHLLGKVAAVSVGIGDGQSYLDLDYSEDSHADVDFNVVGTDAGAYVELQGTAEGRPFDRAAAEGLLDLADSGLARLFEVQASTLATVRRRRAAATDCSSRPDRPTSSASCGSCSTSSIRTSSRSTSSGSRATPRRRVRPSRRTRPSRPVPASTPAGSRRSRTTPASRSTRCMAGPVCGRAATRASTRLTNRTTPSCCRPWMALWRTAVAPAMSASSRSQCPEPPARGAASN